MVKEWSITAPWATGVALEKVRLCGIFPKKDGLELALNLNMRLA